MSAHWLNDRMKLTINLLHELRRRHKTKFVMTVAVTTIDLIDSILKESDSCVEMTFF